MKKLLFILIALSLFSAEEKKDPFDTNSRIKAIFMFNFTRYINWPENYNSGDFVVGVVGETPLLSELVKMAETKKVGNQPIRVTQFGSTNDITDCHLLFLPEEQADKMQTAITKLKGKSTLIVTEKKGLVSQGASINFVIIDNKQKFELSKNNLKQRSLQVHTNLETLAIVVD